MKNKIRHPFSENECLAFEALKSVIMPIGSWDKRFRNQLSEEGLTDKEMPQLWRLFIRYRRQIHGRMIYLDGQPVQIAGEIYARLMTIAEKLAAPDFRRLRKQQAEQKRLDEFKKRNSAVTT